MVVRIAAALSLVAFATCLVMGIVAENSFGTIILRALGAMIATLVVGMIVGFMGQKMLEENLSPEQKNSRISDKKPGAEDR